MEENLKIFNEYIEESNININENTLEERIKNNIDSDLTRLVKSYKKIFKIDIAFLPLLYFIILIQTPYNKYLMASIITITMGCVYLWNYKLIRYIQSTNLASYSIQECLRRVSKIHKFMINEFRISAIIVFLLGVGMYGLEIGRVIFLVIASCLFGYIFFNKYANRIKIISRDLRALEESN